MTHFPARVGDRAVAGVVWNLNWYLLSDAGEYTHVVYSSAAQLGVSTAADIATNVESALVFVPVCLILKPPSPPPPGPFYPSTVSRIAVSQHENKKSDGGRPPALCCLGAQNGNPFAQLQLTQFGQPAQPILYTKPDDPFYDL